MKETGNEFSGILYAGLVLNKGEPKLIEYNVRFGDPECQALCVRLGAQIFDIYFSGAKNELSSLSINEACDSAITVIVAEKGYPKNPRSDCELNDIVDIKYNKALKIFHAGTYFKNNFLFLLISLKNFFFSNRNANGIIDRKPIKNLVPLNVRGPIFII